MSTLLVEALKGAQAEVAAQQGLFEQLRRVGKLSGILAQELRLAVSLSPFGVRAVRVRRCASGDTSQLLATSLQPTGLDVSSLTRVFCVCSALPTAASTTAAAAADASPFGVVLHPAVPYGPLPRHKADIYVPASMHQQCQQQQQQQQHCELPPLPVVIFVHGGIWVTGEGNLQPGCCWDATNCVQPSGTFSNIARARRLITSSPQIC
jgi:acetyl esterase/lipase